MTTEQHYGDHMPVATYAPAHFDSSLHGRGRWCDLAAPPGRDAVRIFTDDQDRLGMIQLSDTRESALLAATLGDAWRAAKAAGTPASVAFDYWADRAGQTVAAGPVQTGSLEMLSPERPG